MTVEVRIQPLVSFEDLINMFDVNYRLQSAFSAVYNSLTSRFGGASPSALADLFFDKCIENKIYPSMLGYQGFDHPLAISVNDCAAHGFPSDIHANFRATDVIKLDATGFNGKYHSDMAHTFCLQPHKNDDRMIKATSEALETAIRACKPGTRFSTIPQILSKVANDHGVHAIRTLTGHGIGQHIHMLPNNLSQDVMRSGDVFTIEPVFAIGSAEVVKKKDNAYWTSDGKNSAHFERVILITEGGHLVMNKFLDL
jgi:methionyl aminopeptidase